jgi:saccharopine dehydrogenase-like NADP-dependent oxidoreductase
MIDYGIPDGDSSMSRTVGLPAAIASRLILQGKITRKGVVVPVTPDIYEPVLAELEQLGISLEEHRRIIEAGEQ